MKKTVMFVVLGIALALSGVCGMAQSGPDYDALVRQGNSQLQAGNNEQTLSSASAAIKTDTNRWEAYVLAGGALMNLKRYEEAVDQFSRAIDRAPDTKTAGLRDLRKKCLLAESGESARPPSLPATTQAENVLWKTIENSSSSEDFQSYLSQYPNGAFAALAKSRIERTEEQRAAAANAKKEATQRAEAQAEAVRQARARQVTLRVFRPNKAIACGMTPEFYVDEQPMAQIAVGTVTTLSLFEGLHTYSARFGKGKPKTEQAQSFDFIGGKEYWVRVEQMWGGRVSVEVVSPSQAQAEYPKYPGKCM